MKVSLNGFSTGLSLKCIRFDEKGRTEVFCDVLSFEDVPVGLYSPEDGHYSPIKGFSLEKLEKVLSCFPEYMFSLKPGLSHVSQFADMLSTLTRFGELVDYHRSNGEDTVLVGAGRDTVPVAVPEGMSDEEAEAYAIHKAGLSGKEPETHRFRSSAELSVHNMDITLDMLRE